MRTIFSFFICAILAVCSSVGYGREIPEAVPVQTALFLKPDSDKLDELTNKATRYLSFDATAFAVNTHGKAAIALASFPVGEDAEKTVVVHRVRPIVDANTRLFAGNTPVALPAVEAWGGYIEGEEGSKVFLCKTGALVIASIQHSSGEVYTLAPGEGTDGYILRQEGTTERAPFTCKAADLQYQLQTSLTSKHSGLSPKVLASALLEVEIAVEADTKFFMETGGTVEKATAYIVSLMSLASVIYEDELNVRFYLPWIKVWTGSPADPYNSNGNAYDLAPKALAYWGDHYPDVQRDLVHVLTSGGGGGIGYQFPLSNGGAQASLCTGSGLGASSPFADHVFPTLDFTYGVYIVAHEIGHSFGAVHSHSCFWNPPLDTCLTRDDAVHQIDDACYGLPVKPKPSSGSIMSYCANTNADLGKGYSLAMTFLPPVASYMRQQAEQSVCVTAPPQPVVILTAPRGGERYKLGEPIAITWLSARVNLFDISYSNDAGKTWRPIANAMTGSQVSWAGPCGRNLLVRIADASNPAVADTSILTFSIEEQRADCLITEYLFRDGSKRSSVCSSPDAIVENAQPAKDRQGATNNAFLFSPIDKSRIVIPDIAFDKPELTVSFWFHFSDGNTTPFQTIVGTDWQERAVFQIYMSNNTLNAAFWTKESGVPVEISTNKADISTWGFGAASYDGEWIRLYFNGVPFDSIRHEGTLQTGNAPVYIGARGTQEYFTGEIDDVRLHCRALAPEEIQALYEQVTTAPQVAELIAPHDETSPDADNSVLFSWRAVPTAASYHLQVATDPNFTSEFVVDISSITATSVPVAELETGKMYYWRLAAKNATGVGPWSSPWSFTLLPVTSAGEATVRAALSAPLPNPAADIVTLQYRLEVPGIIRLGLYNSLGREVRAIDHGWKQQGVVSVPCSTADLPAGVYFLKLFAGDAILTRTLIIAR